MILPGFFNAASDYEDMAEVLYENLSRPVFIADIKRSDWLPTIKGSSFRFYLDKAAERVYDAMEHTNVQQVSIVAHSAGGWLARILLGNQTYDGAVYGLSKNVRALVTLGAPHSSLERYPFRCPERRAGEDALQLSAAAQVSSLQYTNEVYPCCSQAFPHTEKITSVIGDFVRGGFSSPLRLWARQCYVVACESGQVSGDAVVPLSCSWLKGATANWVLPDVGHDRAFAWLDSARGWYGDASVIPQWISAIS